MKLEDAIGKILEGQAVLFAGAGFSYGAKNLKGNVPSAKKLKTELLNDIGMEGNSDYSLEIIANYYRNKKDGQTLVNKLKQQYNIVNIAEHHKKMMDVNWKRVYTTNYDQVIEMASKSCANSYIRDAIVLSDDFENSTKSSVCIHINGYIDRLNEHKLNDEFKLTDRSYSCDSLKGNPWFEFMINDFEAASAIIVIGYSMKFDIDIKRLLSAPEICKKVVFIDSPEIDDISKGILEEYGSCYTIGIQKFSEMIESAKKEYVPQMAFSYKSFKCLYHNTLTSIQPKYEDIVNFYVQGKECEKLFAKDDNGEYKYVLRRHAINYFMRNYRNGKVFIALSNLGNGKSIFLDLVQDELRKQDVKVYIYMHRYDSIDQEIEEICKGNKKSIVIIDNYPGHMDILNKFYQYGHEHITFLLAARSSVNLMFCKQLERALHIDTEDIHPIYLNQLKQEEIVCLAHILESNSLLKEIEGKAEIQNIEDFIRYDCKANLSNLLLELFESSQIKEKLETLYKGLEDLDSLQIKDVAIFSLLKNISNYDLNFYEILDLFNADFIDLKKNEIEFIPEIFEQYDNGVMEARSSIISTSLIKNVIKTEDIVSTMKRAFLAADQKSARTYRELQKSMVSHSQFVFFTDTSHETQKLVLIEGFYNDIRNTKFAKNNPFFWEQFASAYIDMKKFDLVKKCIENALVLAKKNPNFVPFQIKTVQGRYYVEKCYYSLINGKCKASEAATYIQDATEAILLYYNHPENNLYYVFKVVKFFPKIFLYTKNQMDKRELSIYIEKSSIMEKHIIEYININKDSPYLRKVRTWEEELKNSIEEAKAYLKRGNNSENK